MPTLVRPLVSFGNGTNVNGTNPRPKWRGSNGSNGATSSTEGYGYGYKKYHY